MSGRSKHRRLFPILMLAYAAILAAATLAGWKLLWNYLEAYEASRPQKYADAYLDSLTPEMILEASGDVKEQIDYNLQPKAECLQFLSEQIAGNLRAVRASGSDTSVVYALMNGERRMGTLNLISETLDAFGLPNWAAGDLSFDLVSFLGTPVTVTVPQDYTVTVNGVTLDSRYLTQENIPYPLFSQFYGSYELPTLCTYSAGGWFGEPVVQILDRDGIPAASETTDWEAALPQYAGDELPALEEFANYFLRRYVIYSASNADTADKNFSYLSYCLIPGSPLSIRLSTARDGLRYGQSTYDKIVGVAVNHRIQLDEKRFFWDMTYLVDTAGSKGIVQTTNHLRMIITTYAGRYVVESMTSY